MPGALHSISDIWIWSCAELRDLFAISERSGLADPRLQIRRTGAIAIVPDSIEIEAEPLSAAESLRVLGSHSPCIIELADKRGLVRHLSDRKIPYHQALDMAAIDLQEETPFPSDAVYMVTERPSTERLGTRYLIIRRDQIDPIFESFADAKIGLKGIIATNASGLPFEVSKHCLNRIAPKSIRARAGRRLRWALPAVALFLAAAAVGQANYRYYAASEALNEQVQSLQQRATAIRIRLDKEADQQAALAAAQGAKARAISVTMLWRRLSEVLPKTTWLNEFSVQNNLVSIDGYSGDAAGLIRLLDEAAKFSATRFTSPVVRTPGIAGDHFSIQTNAVPR